MVMLYFHIVMRYFSVDIIKYRHLKLDFDDDDTYPMVLDFGIDYYDGSVCYMYKDMDGLFFLGNDLLSEYLMSGDLHRGHSRVVLV